MADLAELEAAEQAAAAAVGAFEAENAEIEEMQKAKRRAVNDDYRAAAAALFEAHQAAADPDRPTTLLIAPQG